MSDYQKISIIIVSYNSEKTIKTCLDSILKYYPGIEIIVVDNNSTDQTIDILKQYKEKIYFIEPKENLGFAKANNLGFQKISGKYIVFLNPDTRFIQPGILEQLKQVLDKNINFGMVGPALVLPGGFIQKSPRNLPTIRHAFEEYILGRRGAYDFYLPEDNGLSEVESIVGACMMLKKDTFEKVGGFDEKYFLYFEDLELCRKISEIGFQIGYFSKARVEHKEGGSGEGQKTSEFLHSSAKKYHGLLEYYLIQSIIKIGNKIHG